MKAHFKKIELLIHYRDREQTTQALQDLGVIHIELDTNFRNEDIEELELRKTRFNRAIEFVNASNEEAIFAESEFPDSGPTADQVIEEILAIRHQQETDQQEADLLQKNRQKLQPWGEFDVDKLRLLTEAGLQVHFCIAEKKEYDPDQLAELTYTIVNETSDRLYLVVLTKDENASVPFEAIELPTLKISDITLREEQLEQNRSKRAASIKKLTKYLPLLDRELLVIENQSTLLLADNSGTSYAEGSIIHLTGWFPAEMSDGVVHYVDDLKLSYSITNPMPGDNVPVLLRNPKYPKLFEAITRIFQLPGYYELDLTPFIAVFYPILFAYCLGDAGYGLILLIAAAAGWFTFLKASRDMAILGIVLGVFTTLMGIVKSGSIFGIPTVTSDNHPILQYFAQYVVIPDDRGVVFNAFNVSLLIGVVQIITGIVISIINKIKYKSLIAGLPQIGKLLIVTSLIWMFLADMQGVEALQPFELIRQSLLGTGVLLVLFFHNMDSPVLARAFSGLLPLFFILTGILGDVLSYVRLFALGVASAVLGLVVNQIGMQIMGDTWWGVLLGIIFLLLGHSLNFALAALGSFVHPLRLTFVEFYNNAQFEGGGVPYNPLRKIKLSHSK